MAAGGTATNVDIGPGRLYYAPLGTAEPTSASAALPSAWQVIGYTETGTTFDTVITSDPIYVAEELDPIRFTQSKRETHLTFEMAEITVNRLALALGNGAGLTANGTAFEPPDPSAIVQVMFIWDSDDVPGASNRRYIFRQCSPSGTVSVKRQKAPNKATFPITFNIEKPSGLKPWKVFPNANGIV